MEAASINQQQSQLGAAGNLRAIRVPDCPTAAYMGNHLRHTVGTCYEGYVYFQVSRVLSTSDLHFQPSGTVD